MLKQLLQECVRFSKAATPSSPHTEWVFPKMLSTSFPALAAFKRFDRKKDAVRQGVNEDHQSNVKSEVGAEVAYDKFKSNTFPTIDSFSQVYNGITYDQLPIIHIKATSNNTIISAAYSNGDILALQSAGTVGFRNARRGTNVAAQAAAIALAGDVIRKDIKAARVCLKGIGPGRLPALKAIQLSGVNVISITDTTPLPHNGNRPKKVRRL